MDVLIAQSAHWLLALVPVLVLLGVFAWLDAFALMRPSELALLLVLGGLGAVLAYPVSGRMLDTLPIGFSNYSVGSSRVDLQACKLEYSIVSPK